MSTASQKEFLNLPFQEKLEFLYGLPARQKRDLILSSPDAERLVRSFAPETLFYTLKEIGVADAGDLLSLAIPEQVRWLFDLDCWHKDQPNLEKMREWIEALAEGGRKRLADGLMGIDLELVSLLLRQYIRVHRLDAPQDLPDTPSDRFIQFDEHYLIESIRYDTIHQYLLEFLEEAFERDYNYFAALMEEIYWGVEAELEEQAYQFRSARLADHGFPDYYDAQALFGYINPQKFLELRSEYAPPLRDAFEGNGMIAPEMAPVSSIAENSLFNTALTAGFAAQGQRQLRSEMALVSNQVLVARSVDFGDPEAVRVAVEMTHNYLNLGLENLAGGELTSAIEHLRATHLQLLFRLGVSLTIDLRKRAVALMGKLGLTAERPREISYLDSPYREALAGFLQRQPQFYGGLDRNGSAMMRDFRSIRDLHLGYAILEQLDAVPDLFKALVGLDIASARFRANIAGHEIRLSQILLTMFARQRLDGRVTFEPLEAERLGEARAAIMTNGRPARLSQDFHESVHFILETRLDPGVRTRSEGFVNSCLNMLEEEFAELDVSREIDPRFIRTLLVRRSLPCDI
ncbi:MAG TPA: DUF6178 family protein [Candidatus Binataceae bacterium]|nr:DUF6178 family protein [Candidatus Binataceae bacterium]